MHSQVILRVLHVLFCLLFSYSNWHVCVCVRVLGLLLFLCMCVCVCVCVLYV